MSALEARALALGNHESRLIPLAAIDEPPNPSRTTMDEQKLDELAENIRARGVKQHLIVLLVEGRYEIIAGHRRYHAAKRAGLVAVPCDVYVSRDDANEADQYAENRFREELSAADEAIWFGEQLERKFGGDVDRLCAHLHEKRDYVEGRLLLFQGDRRVFEALAAGQVNIGVAQQLNRCGDELHRGMLLHQAIHGGATVAIVSGWIAEWKRVHQPATEGSTGQAPPAAHAPTPEMNFYTCALCGKTDNVHTMQAVNMHAYCKAAGWVDMLALWLRRYEYFRYPLTLDEASDLVTELADRFPQMLEQDHRRS